MKIRATLFALLLAAAPLFAEPAGEDQFRTWVRQLASDDIQVRDAAQRELEKLDGKWKPELKKALAAATDPESRARLGSVLEILCHPQWHTDLDEAMALAKSGNKPLLVLVTPGAPDGFS
ncbi:MAG: hypothetical protein K8T20_04995 [Planctomycetes bacterium]|nr:hypothetical protein [Planctomycetota bacterium]